MGNKLTTSSILIGLSLTMTYTGETSADSFDFEMDDCWLQMKEAEYNNPDKLNATSLENYFREAYKEDTLEEDNNKNQDTKFFRAIQEFANQQIELDNDFNEALNELIAESMNNKPRKKRF
jgi:hypothetical protein